MDYKKRLEISIHALRGEGDAYINLGYTIAFYISIHALRGEGDGQKRQDRERYGISIHALRGEGDTPASVTISVAGLFQSTPSVGRATCKGTREK